MKNSNVHVIGDPEQGGKNEVNEAELSRIYKIMKSHIQETLSSQRQEIEI